MTSGFALSPRVSSRPRWHGLTSGIGPAWAHGLGAVFLLACAVTVFGMAVATGEES